jgi:peroxiredoxin family protein
MSEFKKLAIILESEDYEKAHVAAMIASVAAVSEIEVSIFITMNAIYNFLKVNVKENKFTGGKIFEKLKEKKAQMFYDMLYQAKMFGGLKIYACSMVMDLLDLKKEDLLDIVDDHLGLAAFLGIMEGAQTITF